MAANGWLLAPRWRVSHAVVAIGWVLFLLLLQWHLGQGFAAQANLEVEKYDQRAYLRMVAAERAHWWPTGTDGTRNPLFPALLQPWYVPDVETFFRTAKQVNLGFGMLAVLVLGSWFLRRLPLVAALNLTTLAALAVILPISTVVTTEVVLYVALFFLWMECAELLVRNPLRDYAAAGLLAAVAYLAKPGITLLLLAFAGLTLGRWVWGMIRREKSEGWTGGRAWRGGAVFLGCFLVPVLPRAIEAQKVYRDPFQNSSAYGMWDDAWAQSYARLELYNKRRIGEIPEAQRPTPANYWRTHTGAQIAARLQAGADRQFRNFFLPEGRWMPKKNKIPDSQTRLLIARRGLYPLALLAGIAVLAVWTAGRGLEVREERERRWAWGALALVAFAGHFLAYSFYTPIAPGARFLMGLFLPVTFSLALILESLRRRAPNAGTLAMYHGLHLVILGSLLWQMASLTTAQTFGEPRGAF